MLLLALLALGLNFWVSKSRIGFALRCIRQNEDASAMVGINTTFFKVVGFALSAVLVGGAGAMYASWVFYIEPPDVYSVLTSVKPIVMALLGGAGTVFGPIIGAAIFLTMEEFVWRSFLSIHAAVLGLIIVGLIFFLPHGILGLLSDIKKKSIRKRGSSPGVEE
jgi:branched-chain amino acid transport system permease protein